MKVFSRVFADEDHAFTLKNTLMKGIQCVCFEQTFALSNNF
jgi:hypothetical protein